MLRGVRRRSREDGTDAAQRAPAISKEASRHQAACAGDRGAHRCAFESKPFGADEGKLAMRPLPPIWREDEPTCTLP